VPQTSRQDPSPRLSVDPPAGSDAAVFRASPVPAMVMDVDLVIQDANPAYLAATGRELDDIVGRYVFEAFPANPGDPDGDGVDTMRASMQHVLEHREPHQVGVQRYDIPWQDAPEGFVERYWSPVNTPIVDADDELTGILHTVEDVTGFHEDLAVVLDFYRSEIRAQGEDDERRHRRFREYAAFAMRSSRRSSDVGPEVEELRDALTARAAIEQAKGIVMERQGCGPDEAFETLVRSSQASNIKVRDIAAALVAKVTEAR
jgi:hypothetical protein